MTTKFTYKIFPAIGVARVGNAPKKYYIGPEEYCGLPTNPDGTPITEADFRDEKGKLCRQAALFHVYRFAEDGTATEVDLRNESSEVKAITWTVHLANKKPSWYQFKTSLGETGYAPTHPLRNPDADDRHKLIIDAGPRQIAGINQAGVHFDRHSVPKGYTGSHFPKGKLMPNGEAIDTLGELRTDAQGRVLVLGGLGVSGTTDETAVIGNYANNDNWWDDTSDGPVTATIEFVDKSTPVEAAPAWVLVGPPSYAPQIANLVTLYDTIFDAMVRSGHYPELFANGFWKSGKDGFKPNFQTEIKPVLDRASLYPWVAAIPPKPHKFDIERLGRIGPAGLDEKLLQGYRQYILDIIRPPNEENVIVREPTDKYATIGTVGATMMPYLAGDNCLISDHAPSKYLRLTDTQYFFFRQWAEGHFVNEPPSGAITPDGLTRGVLENCVGGAFSPGIEMTWISRNPAIYAAPFRIHAHPVPHGPLSLDFDPRRGMEPGDITRYMAVPWQADFNECSSQSMDGRVIWWWPAQRPEFVYLEPLRKKQNEIPQPDVNSGNQVAWLGNDFDQMAGNFIQFADDVDMVRYWWELGFVLEKEIDGTPRYVEVARRLPRPFYPSGTAGG